MAHGQLQRVIHGLQRAARHDETSSDAELLAAFTTRRDEAAFAALVRRHGPMVLGVCRRVLHDEHLADDAFQATFIVLARKAGALRRRDLVANWLYGVAYRTALEARGQALRRRAVEKQVEVMLHPQARATDDAWIELRRVLDDELARLPDKERGPIVLCDLEGLTRRQAARQLRIPEGTLSNRLAAARRRLAVRLAKHGFTLSGGLLSATLAQGAAADVTGPLARHAVAAALSSGAAPAHVLTIAEGVMKALFLARLRSHLAIVATVLALGCTSVAAALALPGAPPEQPHAAQAEAPRPAAVAQAGAKPADPQTPPAKPAAEEERVLRGHRYGVAGLVFTPDGKHLISADQKIKIWEFESGKEIAELAGHRSYAKGLALTRDGKTLVSASWDPAVKVWDLAGRRERFTITTGDELDISVAVDHDGKLLATGGRQKTLKIWDLETGKLRHGIDAHPRDIQCVAFSHRSQMVASCGYDSEVKLWDAETGRHIRTFPNNPLQFHWDAVAFAPDDSYLAATGVTLRVLDLTTGLERFNVKADDAQTHCVAISPDGSQIATGGANKTVKLWDAKTGKLITSWTGHEGDIASIAFSPDGKWLVSGGNDATIRIRAVPGTAVAGGGTIREIKEGLVVVALGKDHGVKSGDELEVFRLKPKAAYCGRLKVVVVTDREAVCRIVRATAARVQANDQVARELPQTLGD
jgi:RNA polymerase sigma factor (sigma-70 family)